MKTIIEAVKFWTGVAVSEGETPATALRLAVERVALEIVHEPWMSAKVCNEAAELLGTQPPSVGAATVPMFTSASVTGA